jgi:uncharacterized protein YqeY
MIRDDLTDALKTAMKGGDKAAVSTLRLILARLKDKDIEARALGNANGIDEAAVLGMLQGMVKQRRESMALYAQGNRQDLVDQEGAEIAIIERFMPAQLGEDEAAAAIRGVVAELGASSIKDMGRVMAALRERFAGRMDFQKASAEVKAALAG